MGDNILSTFVKRRYTLGKGGPYGHTEEGKLKVYRPGDELFLTDEEAAQKSLAGRLTLVDQKAVMFSEKVAAVPTIQAATPKKAVAVVDENDAEAPAADAAAAADTNANADTDDSNVTAKRTKIADWKFVPKTLTDTLLALVDDLDDPADLKAMFAAEKTRNDGGRARVRQAINSRTRQLNMMKARAARKVSLDKKRAEKLSGEGEKEEVGTE